MFSRMDPDNSGFVDESEFEAYIRDQQMGMSKARIKQLFHTIKVAKESSLTVVCLSYRTAPLWRDRLRTRA